MAGDTESSNDVPLRELNQQTSRVMARVEAGETVTITKDGVPIGDIVPRGGHLGPPSYPFRTDPMGPLDLPDLEGPALTDDEIDDVLRGMGSTGGMGATDV